MTLKDIEQKESIVYSMPVHIFLTIKKALCLELQILIVSNFAVPTIVHAVVQGACTKAESQQRVITDTL